ncbi:MAG: DUF4345 domain-containing protein [Cyanobacteria bacterium SBLK]|nr:DUF4345 domain-containing protein [Cyanobacteria bacterium SBLK]
MQNSIFLKIVLYISGLVAIAIAGFILLSPTDFYATNHIDIGGNPNLLSEIRAPAGALLSFGILMLMGAFIPRLAFTSILLSTVLYLAYGLSRFVGMLVDGLPVDSLIWSAVIEVVLGLVSLFCLWKYQLSQSEQDV